MANPLMGMMGGNNPMAAIRQAMRMINQIKHSGNPQSAINAMAQSNPDIKKSDGYVQRKKSAAGFQPNMQTEWH